MSWRPISIRGGALVASALLILSLLIGVQRLSAQDADSITLGVSPQILEITANPGESVKNAFRLTNASKENISIKTTPKNFTPRGEEGAVDLTEDKTSYSLAEWIDVNPKTVTIGPNKTEDFDVTISVPDNAEPGSHFGSVVFQTIPPEQEGSTALVSQEIAPVILVRVAGDTTESVEVEEFKSEFGFYSNEKAINLISRIKNDGNVHFKPNGRITIKNTFGSEVASLDLDKRNVLPDSIRQITTEWLTGGFKIGRYNATLSLSFGDNEIRTAETSFIIFPYQVILPIVIGVGLLVFVFYKGRKRIAKAIRVLSGKDDTSK